jgi:hypothetical protein
MTRKLVKTADLWIGTNILDDRDDACGCGVAGRGILSI